MRTLVVTGGKGGVGKTNVAANLAILSARRGIRTVLIDADFGLANVDVVLGFKPKQTLRDVAAGKCSLEAAIETHSSGVRVLAGASGFTDLAGFDLGTLQQLGFDFAQLAQDTDLLIVDTAAGIGEGVLSLVGCADDALVVLTQDPSSVVDAYAVIKLVSERAPEVRVHCLINMATTPSAAKLLFAKLKTITEEYLGMDLSFAGHLELSNAVRGAVLQRKPFVDEDPPTARQLSSALDVLLRAPSSTPKEHGFFARLFGRSSARRAA